MKKFQIFRYIKNLRYLILLVTLMGCAAIYVYTNRNQHYTAQTIIKYTNPTAKQGTAPDGSPIDPKEVYSASVITDVISDLGLYATVDQIRSSCSVSEVISDDEQKRKTAILEAGDEYNEFTPVYCITVGAGSSSSKGYVRDVLNSIIDNYYVYYSKKYIDSAVIPNNTLNISVDKYDYVDCAEILEKSTDEISEFLSKKSGMYPTFRSAATGYTFDDLQKQYEYIRENEIPQYYARILGKRLTRDKEKLLKNFYNRRDMDQINATNLNGHIEQEWSLIQQFGDKVTQSDSMVAGAIGDNTDAIIRNVEGYESQNPINADTTYDDLVDYYVNLRSEKNKNEIDIEYCNKILSTFDSPEVVNDTVSTEVVSLAAEMTELISRLNEMYSAVEKTSNELNEYSGANNISTLTGTYVEEKINVDLYIAMAFVLFLVFGCAGAILIGRAVDFWEYFLYTDKKTGTANRVRCDIVIDEYSKKFLDDNFSCVVFKLNQLQNANSHKGREFGDSILKDFGTLLLKKMNGYGFVGYNNGNMFIVLLENCSHERAGKFVESVREEASMENEERFSFLYGVAESFTDNIYGIRELLKTAISRLA